MTTTDPPSPADPRFDAFADVSMEPGLPEDIAVQIRAGLRRQYDKPPVNETEAVLRANATPDRVRQLIYWPDADDAALYPMLIASPPPGAPKDHPAARCQVTYLMALYLHHAKRWTFVKPFVLAGGLRATADLLVHPNLHLRGQAMEAFGLMTSESLFPWHDPPRPGTSDVAVHQRVLELARSPLLPIRRQLRRLLPRRIRRGASNPRLLRLVAQTTTLSRQRSSPQFGTFTSARAVVYARGRSDDERRVGQGASRRLLQVRSHRRGDDTNRRERNTERHHE